MQHIAASMSLRRDSCVLHVHVGDQIPDFQSEQRLHACTLLPCKNDTTPQKVWNSLGTENWNVSGSDAWWSAPFKAGALRTVSEDSLPHVHPHNSTSRWVEVFWKSALVVSATSQSLRTCANKSARLDVSDMHMNSTYHPTVWNYVIYFETVAHKKSPQPQKSSRVIVASGVPANFSFHLELLRYAPECPKGPAESPAPSYETASIRNMCIVQTIKTMALPGHWTDKSKRIGVKAHTGRSSEQRQATCNALPDSFDWSTQVRSSRPCSPVLEACAWLNYSSPLVATRPGRSQPHMARWLLSPSPPLCPFPYLFFPHHRVQFPHTHIHCPLRTGRHRPFAGCLSLARMVFSRLLKIFVKFLSIRRLQPTSLAETFSQRNISRSNRPWFSSVLFHFRYGAKQPGP